MTRHSPVRSCTSESERVVVGEGASATCFVARSLGITSFSLGTSSAACSTGTCCCSTALATAADCRSVFTFERNATAPTTTPTSNARQTATASREEKKADGIGPASTSGTTGSGVGFQSISGSLVSFGCSISAALISKKRLRMTRSFGVIVLACEAGSTWSKSISTSCSATAALTAGKPLRLPSLASTSLPSWKRSVPCVPKALISNRPVSRSDVMLLMMSRIFETVFIWKKPRIAGLRGNTGRGLQSSGQIPQCQFEKKLGNKKTSSRVLTLEGGSTIQETHNLARRLRLSCKRTLEIGAYVDGELNPSEAAAVQRDLDECDACSRDYHYHLALRSSLGDSSLYYRTPLELKMRIRSISQTEEQSEASKRPMLPW